MRLTICELLDDVRDDTDAVHGDWIVVLDPTETARSLGYARVSVADPVARRDGIAVVAPGGHAPDPVQILVAPGGPGPRPPHDAVVHLSELPASLVIRGRLVSVVARRRSDDVPDHLDDALGTVDGAEE